LGALGLGGCAGSKPPADAPFVDQPRPDPTLSAPPPAPPPAAFNVRNARPLPVPPPLPVKALPVPAAPPPPVAMTPLPNPEPVTLSALPPVAPPEPVPARAEPMPRPDLQLRTMPADSAEPPPRSAATLPMAGGVAAPESSWRLEFVGSSLELPDSARSVLQAVAERMNREPNLRIRLKSFASGRPDDPVAARHLSLQRALKVREALGRYGIASTRIDVLALGLGAGAPPVDRLELISAE
jgi:outer membrane protein OmpA-like peptidoglycan-associated protein